MAQSRHRITLGAPPDPRNRALIDGLVSVEGYEIAHIGEYSPGEFHYRFVQGEYDVAEMSAATFLRTREQGRRFIALPIFFQRGPRQRNIFYREGRLHHPTELKGKKIGCFRYGATAVSWARGFLLDEYGLKTTDASWFVSGREVYIGSELTVKVERIDPPPPFGQEKAQLAELLSRGELEAALVPGDSGYLGLFGGGKTPKQMGKFPGVKPLFEDTEEIVGWVKRTGIYPIIHLMAMKRETADKYPDLPAKLIEAFREANRLAVNYMSPEEAAGYAREREVLGEDPYACVLGETEKRTMRALNRYQIEQGLMKKELPLESLFVREAFS
ncbi:MAG TPA: hypothetical protein VNL14_05625 [Candidatus Acidoferrales bacterium]|nr:hypothetical protein [Candidatus Acidoferrales bacterium]